MIALLVAFLPLAISIWLTNRLSRRSWTDSARAQAPIDEPEPWITRRTLAPTDEPIVEVTAPPDWTALDDIQLDRLLKDSSANDTSPDSKD